MNPIRFLLGLSFIVLATNAAQAQSDLARAYRVIAGKQFVDLTHSFGPQTPVWSGFGQAKLTPAADPKTKQALHHQGRRLPHDLL